MSPSTASKRVEIPFQPNPFANIAVGSGWADPPADVPEINGEAFRMLRNGVRSCQVSSEALSIVVTGEAGSGKTHLLGRLRSELQKGEDQAFFVYVRCNASAQTLWRNLRTCVANDLLMAGAERLEARNLDRVNHLGVRRAVEHLLMGSHVLAAKAWLRGEPLAESDLAELGIGSETDEVDRSLETDAKKVVEALLRLLSPTLVVICFDQVEAVETYQGETAGYHAMGQMVSALIDGNAGKLMLVSCVLSDYEDQLERISNKADRDRWLQQKVTLRAIELGPAMELVKSRLGLAAGLTAMRAKHPENPIWPLEPSVLAPLFEATGRCLPRKLIQVCRAEFDRLMGDVEEGPQVSREDFIQERFGVFLSEARRQWRKMGGEVVLESCLPWLLENMGMRVSGKSATPGYVHLAGKSPSKEAGYLFCYTPGTPFTTRLRKAATNWTGSPDLTIVSDPEIRLKPELKGSQYLGVLKAKGARQVHPTAEAMAVLLAIRNLTTTARAGDLSHAGETVSEQEVTNWILANLPRQVETLWEELAEAPSRDDGLKGRLLGFVSERKIVEAAVAAEELSISMEEVAACASRYPMHFGVLEGPPLLLFEAVEGSDEEAGRG